MNVFINTIALSVGLILLSGCAILTEQDIYERQDLDLKEIPVNRVAILPSQSPSMVDQQNLWEPENWELLSREFQSRGYDVVDFHTTMLSFRHSGLNLNIIKDEQDKLSEIADALNADLVILPNYATSSASRSYLILNYMKFNTLASFHIYSSELQKFITRIDTKSRQRVRTGFLPLALVTASFAVDDNEIQDVLFLASGAFSAIDMFRTFQSERRRWRRAFELSISEAFEPFFNTITEPGQVAQNANGFP